MEYKDLSKESVWHSPQNYMENLYYLKAEYVEARRNNDLQSMVSIYEAILMEMVPQIEDMNIKFDMETIGIEDIEEEMMKLKPDKDATDIEKIKNQMITLSCIKAFRQRFLELNRLGTKARLWLPPSKSRRFIPGVLRKYQTV